MSTLNVDWPVYGGSSAGDRYSTLTQIDRSNVGQLQVAWRFDMAPGGLQTSPLMIDGTLYANTPTQSVLALDAASGKLKWRFDSDSANPQSGSGLKMWGSISRQPVRGFSYWRQGKSKRLFVGGGTFLYALDPDTGALIRSFGEDGRIDLRKDLGRDYASIAVFPTTPGIVYKDLIILGFRTAETNPAAPGAVRAYDVRTGKLRWIFHLIPRPGEPGHETWPAEAWKTAGGANVWAGFALDEKRGIVYAPTGSATDDFYGADRHGNNLYADSLVALNAATGKRLWHFQTVHHNIWDWDLSAPPLLLTVTHDGRRVDAVAQASKNGFLFVFDRVTGAPLFPIEERPVPASNVPGERASPTQPFPLKPAAFARQRLTRDLLTTRTPEVHADALKELDSLNYEGMFTPLTVDRQTILVPSFDGGAEWGGLAADRERGVIYLNAIDMVSLGGLAKHESMVEGGDGGQLYARQCAVCHGMKREGAPPDIPRLADVATRLSSAQIAETIVNGKGRMPGFPQFKQDEIDALVGFLNPDEKANAAVTHGEQVTAGADTQPEYLFTGYKKWLDKEGYPAAAPPWGTFSAIDLNTGEYLWKIPLGEYPELKAQGIPPTGTENYGGPVVTASGLVFIGATVYDRKFRAFDARSGRLLWEGELPYAGVATPITYAVDGRQYVVIACSGARNHKGPQGAAYVTFALPN